MSLIPGKQCYDALLDHRRAFDLCCHFERIKLRISSEKKVRFEWELHVLMKFYWFKFPLYSNLEQREKKMFFNDRPKLLSMNIWVWNKQNPLNYDSFGSSHKRQTSLHHKNILIAFLRISMGNGAQCTKAWLESLVKFPNFCHNKMSIVEIISN